MSKYIVVTVKTEADDTLPKFCLPLNMYGGHLERKMPDFDIDRCTIYTTYGKELYVNETWEEVTQLLEAAE